ncbi:YciI family protein [Streptomyces griseoaurantiacus]|uniref:hypothetical protein n=1 Tax=Streptomyces griseoaurantiacus TaxID=68213 RepID=UPI00352DA422
MSLAVTTRKDGQRPPQPAVEDHRSFLDERCAVGRQLRSRPLLPGGQGVPVLVGGGEETARALLAADPVMRDRSVTHTLGGARVTPTVDRATVET